LLDRGEDGIITKKKLLLGMRKEQQFCSERNPVADFGISRVEPWVLLPG